MKDSQNENQNEKSISYKIRSMESDLKNLDYKEGSYQKKDNDKNQTQKKELNKAIKKASDKKETKKERVSQENPPEEKNPFLENIQEDKKNIFAVSAEQADKNKDTDKKRVSTNKTGEVPPKTTKTQEKDNPKEPQKDKKFNVLLLVFIISASLVVFGAGAYYYFFVLNNESEKKSPKETQEEVKQEKKDNKDNEEEVKQEKKVLSQYLSSPDIIIEKKEEETLSDQIIKKITIPENKKDKLYAFKKDQTFLSGKEIMEGLNLDLNNEELLSKLNQGWLAVNESGDPALIFEIQDGASIETKEIIKSLETTLPKKLENLYSLFDKQNSTNRKISFEESNSNKGFRYFNFKKGAPENSLDWGLLNGQYLIFSTSKDMTEKIINVENSINTKDSLEEAESGQEQQNSKK